MPLHRETQWHATPMASMISIMYNILYDKLWLTIFQIHSNLRYSIENAQGKLNLDV